MEDALWLKKFSQTYSNLAVNNLDTLKDIYHPEVNFIDPMHSVVGLDALLDYFEKSYQNINSCHFVINKMNRSKNEAAIYWSMTFSHQKLNGTKPISIEGHSYLKEQDDLIIYHRDYFDVGAMVYENIPVIGSIIRMVKNRAAQ